MLSKSDKILILLNIIIPEKQVFIDFSSVVASPSSMILHTRPSLSLIILPYPVGFSVSNDAIRISFDFRESLTSK